MDRWAETRTLREPDFWGRIARVQPGGQQPQGGNQGRPQGERHTHRPELGSGQELRLQLLQTIAKEKGAEECPQAAQLIPDGDRS